MISMEKWIIEDYFRCAVAFWNLLVRPCAGSFYVSLTLAKIIFEEEASNEKLPP